jgi:RNase H-fold protein (predicted Holliday junction resolvase)
MKSKIMGIDYGSKRVGVALSDEGLQVRDLGCRF